jgi:hypothetical protein
MGIFVIMTGKVAFLVCLASTLFMTGLIWFVQVVHYPLFAEVDPEAFSRYHEAHVRTTTRVVLVPMVLELVSSVVLILQRPAELDPTLVWAGLVAAGGAWLSTILLQVPRHKRLARSFDPAVHPTLVSTNILRTACWTAHAAILLVMVARLFP